MIEVHDLPIAITETKTAQNGAGTYKARVDAFIKEMFQAALKKTNGNYAEAASDLDLTASYMRRKAITMGLKMS